MTTPRKMPGQSGSVAISRMVSALGFRERTALVGDGVVVLVENDDVGLVGCSLFGGQVAEGKDNQSIPFGTFVCGGTIETHNPAVCWCRDDVRLKALSVGQVGNENFFMWEDSGGVHQGAVNRHTSVVLQRAFGDTCVVQFCF